MNTRSKLGLAALVFVLVIGFAAVTTQPAYAQDTDPNAPDGGVEVTDDITTTLATTDISLGDEPETDVESGGNWIERAAIALEQIANVATEFVRMLQNVDWAKVGELVEKALQTSPAPPAAPPIATVPPDDTGSAPLPEPTPVADNESAAPLQPNDDWRRLMDSSGCDEVFPAQVGGVAYDACEKNGKITQPNLPDSPGDFEVELTLNKGYYIFYGVEAAIFNMTTGQVEVGRRENGKEFYVPEDDTKYNVVGFASDAGGFSADSEAVSQDMVCFPAYLASNNSRAEEYDFCIGGDEGDWFHQPYLPTVRYAHWIEGIQIPEGQYDWMGKECRLTQTGTPIVGHANHVEFNVGVESSDFRIDCGEGAGSGASFSTISGGPNNK